MSALRASLLVLILGVGGGFSFCGTASDSHSKAVVPVVEGLVLGQSRLNDILYTLGSPRSISLAGSDSEHALFAW